jgi:hypothetical protein
MEKLRLPKKIYYGYLIKPTLEYDQGTYGYFIEATNTRPAYFSLTRDFKKYVLVNTFDVRNLGIIK